MWDYYIIHDLLGYLTWVGFRNYFYNRILFFFLIFFFLSFVFSFFR